MLDTITINCYGLQEEYKETNANGTFLVHQWCHAMQNQGPGTTQGTEQNQDWEEQVCDSTGQGCPN